MRLILLLLLALQGAPALGQTTTPAQPAAPQAAPHPGLSQREAQDALAVLRDDKRRNELMSTLDAIAKVAPASAPASPPATATATAPTTTAPTTGTAATTPAATPQAAAIPAATTPAATTPAATTPAATTPAAAAAIAPDSVGVQLVGRISGLLSIYSQQLTASVRSVNDLPLLWRWLSSLADDPDARAAMVDAGIKLLLVLAGAVIGEVLVRLTFRRIRAALTEWAPRRASVVPDGHPAAGAVPQPAGPATEVRRHRFEGAIAALRQLPYLTGRLLIDLLPVAAFVAVAELLLGAGFVELRATRSVILEAVQAYAYARVILAIAAFLFSPETPRLRLLGVSDWAAAFLTRWTRRIVIIAVTGIALANIGVLFGMFRTAQLAVLKLFGLIVHTCLVVAVLQARAPVAHRLRARRTASGVWARLLNRFAGVWHFVAIFYIVGLWLVWAVEVRNGYERLLRFCAVTVAIVVVARLIAVLLLGGLDRIRAILAADGYNGLADRAGFYYPALRGVVSLAIWLGAGIALFEAWGLPVLFWLTAGGLGKQVAQAILTVAVTVLLAIVLWEAANAGIGKHLSHLSGTSQLARAGRLRTLLPFLRTTLLVAIIVIVGMTVLSAIGVNIAPLLAGAGVVGIAVGFGSQKLVQDLITGLFLLLENAMQVGDVVTLAGMSGTVEALTIRTIRLRALDGAVHLIPFSAVTTVTNQTRDYGYAVLDVSIGLNEKPSRVEPVLRQVAAEMQADAAWQSMVLDKLDVLGVETLTDLAWTMRVRIKTQPGSRWAVARELRRRIKDRFDESAIESPFTSHRALSRDQMVPSAGQQDEPPPAELVA